MRAPSSGHLTTRAGRGGRLTVVLGLVTCLLGLVACSSGSGSTSADSSATGSQGTQNCVEAAKAAVAKGMAPISPQYPSPINVTLNRGKTIWYVSFDQEVQVLDSISQGFVAAAEASGLKVHIFDGAGNAATQAAGVNQAVSSGADAILLQGIDPSLVSTALAKAKAAGIPVIDSFNGNYNAPLPTGIVGHVSLYYPYEGSLMVDYALANSNCEAHILELTSSLSTGLAAKSVAMGTELNRLCPKTCSLDIQQVNFTTITTQVPQLVTTNLERDPAINWIMPTADAIAVYAVPTVDSSRSKARVISTDGQTQDLGWVRGGQAQVADISYPPLQYIGWYQVDDLQRALLHAKLASGLIPVQLFDHATLAADASAMFPKFAGFEASYERLWGLK